MIAVDTNILVYAHRRDSNEHAAAAQAVRELAEGREAWAIPWPCVHEFFSIVTHPRIFSPPTSTAQAIDQIEAWLDAPNLALLGEEAGYWQVLRKAITRGKINGPRVHDARIAAICLHHGVRALWSADRDFNHFPELTVKNPLLA